MSTKSQQERPSVTCYFAKGGQGKVIAPAFAEGCGGAWQRGGPVRDGWAAIYGVKPETADVWKTIQSRRFWYIDNAYFGRGDFFRITEGAIQHNGKGVPSEYGRARFRQHGVTIEPWRKSGRTVLVCLQSDNFMSLTCGIDPDEYRLTLEANIKKATDREIVIRTKASETTFEQDLQSAWCVITHTSNCAVQAVLAGVPAFVTGPSAALPMGSADLGRIEDPVYPDGRRDWAALLAENQWTVEEIRCGDAWRALRGEK